jgi:hypothetical protein
VQQLPGRPRPPGEARQERGVEGLAFRDTQRDRDDQREEVRGARAGCAEQGGDDGDEDEREQTLQRERAEGEKAELPRRMVGERRFGGRFANG